MSERHIIGKFLSRGTELSPQHMPPATKVNPLETASGELQEAEISSSEKRIRFKTMINIYSNAVQYASHASYKEGVSRAEMRKDPLYKALKKDAISASLQLYDIGLMPEDKQGDTLDQFRKKWGYNAGDHERLYKAAYTDAKQRVNAADEDHTGHKTDKSAGKFLLDRSVPRGRKIELLRHAGYSKKDAAIAAAAIVTSGVVTVGSSFLAEGGAIAASGYGATNPFLEGLSKPDSVEEVAQMAKALGVDVAVFAGFYGVTYLYAKRNVELMKRTGFGLNVAAAIPYHIDKAQLLPEKLREKHAIRALFGFNLSLDAPYLTTILIPHVGTSMMAGSYLYGMGFTAAQLAVCEAGVLGAKGYEVFRRRKNNKTQKPMLQNTQYDLAPSEQEIAD